MPMGATVSVVPVKARKGTVGGPLECVMYACSITAALMPYEAAFAASEEYRVA